MYFVLSLCILTVPLERLNVGGIEDPFGRTCTRAFVNEVIEGVQCMLVEFFARKEAWLKTDLCCFLGDMTDCIERKRREQLGRCTCCD